MTAPGRATATVCPRGHVGRAADDLAGGPPSPSSCTWQTRRRSASGCCSALSTLPDDEAVGGRHAMVRGPPRPRCRSSVSRSSIARSSRPGAQYSRSQGSGDPHQNCSRKRRSFSKNRRRSGIAVLEHRDPLDAHAEREALDLLGVIARGVGPVGEHVGVDLAGAEDLHPRPRPCTGGSAEPSPVKPADAVEARDVDLDAGLGEREEVRAQAHLALVRRRSRGRTPAACPSGRRG